MFAGFRPAYKCQDINTTLYLQDHKLYYDNESDIRINYQKCEIDITINTTGTVYHYNEACPNGYKYSIPTDRSTVTEWNLVCDGAERSEFAKTLLMLGQAAGAVIFTPLADRYGRKPCNVIARILYFVTALATVFTPNIAAFSAFRFLQGTFQGGSVMTSVILYVELLPKELRHRTEGAAMMSWSAGLVLTSTIGYLCRDISWRYMQLILALITCHALFDWKFLDESLRWLVANGKHKEIENQIRKAAKINNTDYNTVVENIQVSKEINVIHNKNMDEEEDSRVVLTVDNEGKAEVQKYTVFTVLKHRRILMVSVVLWIAWITNTLTYYGLMLTTSKLSGDRYLNNILASLVEFPAVIMQQLLVNRIGRKFLLISFHGIAGVSLILATLCATFGGDYSWLPYLGSVFSFVGRFAITGSFSTVCLYTPELYPTNLRNVGLGMASTVSRIGSMLSPFAITLAEYISWGPAAIFAAMNVIVTLSLLLLPETMGRELPTTVAELKTWYRHKELSKK